MIGSRLGTYEITSKLGEGGMGEVYRATDSKLRREVAIKVLPAAFTEDKERLARFEREAQVLAQLQHPNIASIYGLEESGGVRALVMELVEGPTLAERLEGGAVPLEESLSIARRIAEALEEAHEKGIIHRDLKPQNIKASIDGKVKVLDFGLAKAMDAGSSASGGPATASPTLMNSPTLTAAGTQLGVILGTAAYMSPEQARGGAVDKRADIWAFGVVLYELLSGRSVFVAETVPDTLAAVLTRELDWNALPEATPPAIRRLLRRCLERKPKDRLHDIADARIVLDEVLRGDGDEAETGTGARVAPARRRGWALPVALVAGAALGVAGGWLLRPRDAARTPTLQLSLSIPPDYNLPLDTNPGVSLSADGRRQVVSVIDEQGQTHLSLRDLDQIQPRILPGTEGALDPVLSPDGDEVAFVLDDGLQRMSIAGGPPIRLADSGSDTRGATWSSDGFIYFSPGTNGPLYRVPENGGTVETVTELDAERHERTHRWPAALPDGSAVLFTSDTVESSEFYDDARIEAVRPATGERQVILEGSSQARFLPPEHLVFARGGTLFAVRFDPRTLTTIGSPAPLVQEVSTEVSSGAVRFAIAASGTAIWLPGESSSVASRLEWIEPDETTEPLDLPLENYSQLVLSPDERRLAVTIDGTTTSDLWVVDLERMIKSRLTFRGSPSDLVWSRDGRRIAFSGSNPEGGRELYWKAADGSGEAELMVGNPGDDYPGTFTPDGAALLFEAHVPDRTDPDIARLDLASGEIEPLLTESFAEYHPALSPDGRWLAYSSGESLSRSQVLVRRYPELTGKWQVSLDGGEEPGWAPEGNALYYRGGGTLYRVAVDTREGFVAEARVPVTDGMPRGKIANTYAVARGGRVLVTRDAEPARSPREVYFTLDLAPLARRITEPKR